MGENMRLFKTRAGYEFFEPLRVIAHRPRVVRRFARPETREVRRGYLEKLRKEIYLIVKTLLFRAVAVQKQYIFARADGEKGNEFSVD